MTKVLLQSSYNFSIPHIILGQYFEFKETNVCNVNSVTYLLLIHHYTQKYNFVAIYSVSVSSVFGEHYNLLLSQDFDLGRWVF